MLVTFGIMNLVWVYALFERSYEIEIPEIGEGYIFTYFLQKKLIFLIFLHLRLNKLKMLCFDG
ncbi:hypothetical protein BK123_19535 [Paenibacillus lautus]|uniref:Uncharacterized protein n=1 Tax=Paenibacillus lautus TaxID=1401 RepID=A0A1R1AZX6_PAELA|nr:hypothetical protein BK123_19535 [Paenibacillus lautus]